MARTYTFEPEKLIIGVIYSDRDVLEKTLEILVNEFGEIDAVSEEYSFSDEFSTYYDTELGGKGIRKIYSFKEPVDPSRQAKIKIFTNNIESVFEVLQTQYRFGKIMFGIPIIFRRYTTNG